MRIRAIIFLLVFPLMLSVPARSANRYSLERRTVEGVATFRLSDEKLNQQVSIAPEVGNLAYEFLAGGKNIFYRPAPLGELRERKILAGNPFLSPWVSRIDGEEYYVGGKKYRFNNALGNLHRDSNNRILHGLLIWSPYWKVAKSGASDAEGAYLVSRLDFYRYPDLMAQFPFAHTLEMTYRLKDGQLEVGMRVTNLAEEAMPIAFGFHPYFQLSDAPRDEWRLRLAARERWSYPGGFTSAPRRAPVTDEFPHPDDISLAGRSLDNVFFGTLAAQDGRSHFAVTGKREKIEVILDKEYDVVVIYAPEGKNFLCIEPWTAAPNAFNMHHRGFYPEMKSVAAGETFSATFSIRPVGF